MVKLHQVNRISKQEDPRRDQVGVPVERVGGIRVVIKLNDESLLANVGRDALKLKSLEDDPIEKLLMSGGKFPQVFNHVLVVVTTDWLLVCSRDLRSGMLADRFV